VVYTSSIAAVGIGTPGHPATEVTPWNYGWAAQRLHSQQYQSQQVALRYARQGLPVVIVNPRVPHRRAGHWADPHGADRV